MNRLVFTNQLPLCDGLLPDFETRFSGWHLGMGLPDTLTGLLHGLTVLGEERPPCRDVAMGMALWSMQTHPLAPGVAGWAIKYANAGLTLSAPLAKLAIRLAALPPIESGETTDTWHELARQDDRSLILRFLTAALSNADTGLAWLGHCWQDLLFLNQPELSTAALDMIPWNDDTLPLKARLEAELAFHSRPPEDALAVIEGLDESTWGLWRAAMGAELLLRMGHKGEAKGTLAALWKAIPWHVNLTLKLHGLFNAAPAAGEATTNDVAVLLYSWNKADLLADTLDSLARSELGQARIYALDNGSTDHTQQVLTTARERFGADRFHIETLPVNVGAPAARNWLLSLDGVRKASWAAFLDDDVVLPEDWLTRLLGAAKVHPDAGAAGCRITAATPPFGLQSADYNLFPTPPAPTEPGELPNRVLVFDNCAGSLDTGLYSYTRPCLSVSGCCHLISLEAVRQAGGFDLRYTPSQFDDLDRDLRSALAGLPAVYVGELAVRHVQHSSLAKSKNVKQIGHVLGNKFKLDTKYTDDELIRLGHENKQRLWADLRSKHQFLLDRLGLRA